MKSIKQILMYIFCTLSLTGCMIFSRSTLTYTGSRPAEIVLKNEKTIGILPFRYEEHSDNVFDTIADVLFWDLFTNHTKDVDGTKASRYIYDRLNAKFRKSALTIVPTQSVITALKTNSKNPADIYITGSIENFTSNIESSEMGDEESFDLDVEVTVNYRIIDGSTRKELFSNVLYLYGHDFAQGSKNYLSDEYDAILPALKDATETIFNTFYPHEIYRTLRLISSKDLISPDMNYALRCVKKGKIDKALETFLNIYKTEGEFEAGYNAVLIYESQHNFDEAITLLKELEINFSNSQYYSATTKELLDEINEEIAYQKKYTEQTGKNMYYAVP